MTAITIQVKYARGRIAASPVAASSEASAAFEAVTPTSVRHSSSPSTWGRHTIDADYHIVTCI